MSQLKWIFWHYMCQISGVKCRHLIWILFSFIQIIYIMCTMSLQHIFLIDATVDCVNWAWANTVSGCDIGADIPRDSHCVRKIYIYIKYLIYRIILKYFTRHDRTECHEPPKGSAYRGTWHRHRGERPGARTEILWFQWEFSHNFILNKIQSIFQQKIQHECMK